MIPSALGRARARIATLVLAASLVAACGGTNPSAALTAAPTGTPIPPVLPTATPFDVGAAFLAIVRDPEFAAKMTLDGTIKMGLEVAMSGTIEGAGDSSRQSMTITFGSTETTQESVRIGTRAWSRTAPGPWLETPAGSGSSSMNDWLGDLATLDDLGSVTKGGEPLHHLRPATGSKVPSDMLGLDPAQFSEADITIELYARADGTPALFEMSGSWVQKVNGQDITVELAIDIIVSNVGVPLTLSPPDDVWTRYKSELGYAAAHPADFAVDTNAGGDTYRSDGVDWFYVFPYADGKGMSAEGFRDAIIEGYEEDPGPPRDDPVAVSVDGNPAWRVAFEFEANDGSDIVLVDVLTVHGDFGWEISLVTTPALEATETDIFDAFLATFEFAE